VRLRIGNHRVQLNVGDGAVTVREIRAGEAKAALGVGCSITVRVENIDAHCARARDHGARITEGPVTHPYGERQYNAVDFAGYTWTFSESVADVHPEVNPGPHGGPLIGCCRACNRQGDVFLRLKLGGVNGLGIQVKRGDYFGVAQQNLIRAGEQMYKHDH
jgi:hypothetical protein